MKTLFAVAVVFVASSAVARTQIPVTFDASITREDRLELRVTSHSEFVQYGILEVKQGEDVQQLPLALVLGSAIPVVVELAPATEDVAIRFVMENGEPAAADMIHVGRTAAGARRVISPTEREKERAAGARNQTIRENEVKARQYVASILARGKRPVPITDDDPNDPWVIAWNKVVAQMAPPKTPGSRTPSMMISDCAPWVPSPYNYVYPLRGNFGYIDELYGYNRYFRAYWPGYSITAVVQEEVEDQCGNFMVRNRLYSQSTGYNGSFYFSSINTIQPPGYNPVSQFRATTSFVGLPSGSSMTPFVHTLPSSQLGFYWSGAGEAVIDPYFSSGNSPHPYFFRWEEEIREHKSLWSSYGFSSYYTPFRAAYAADGGIYGAYFYNYAAGMVVFDNLGRWVYGFVMAHELGHHFQYRLQGDRLTSTGPAHQICTVLLDKDAFIEGFADWYGVFWNSEGRDAFGITCTGSECYSVCSNGYRKEGNVMAYFWDIFDATNHSTHDQSWDSIFKPLTTLKSWRATGDYTSFPDWYNDFYSKGIWSGYETVVDELRYVNKVHVAQ